MNDREKEIRVEDKLKEFLKGHSHFPYLCLKEKEIKNLLFTIDALRAENAAMREAIEPITKAIKYCTLADDKQGICDWTLMYENRLREIYFGDLRKLAEAGKVE